MPANLKELETRLTQEINNIAIAMSKTTAELEAKMAEIGNEHSLINNRYSNLENRLSYLEKKILKRK